jgi:4-amino-4-deoxy-L-arabinose transferase-like glycosyltransferase
MLGRFQLAIKQSLMWILLLALAVRVVAAFLLGNTVSGFSGAHDEVSYSMLGQRFASGYGMTFPEGWYPWIQANAPQSYYSYTISLFLAGIYALFGYHPLVARLIMGVLSTAIVLMIFLITRRLFNERIALLASLIAAIYAYLVFYGVTLVTETPFTLMLLIAIYICLKIRDGEESSFFNWIVLGGALAITVLLRMAVIFFVPILLLWLGWQMQARRKFYHFAIPLLIIVFAVLPFTIRNYSLWGHFSLLETQFGHVFWNGNHPGHDGDFHPYKVFPIPPEVLASQNDVEITNQLLRMGIENVLRDPLHFWQLTLTRLREFFTFWPTEDSTMLANILRVFSFGLLVPFALIGLATNVNRYRDLMPIYLFLIIHTGIYAVSWTMIRYRNPLEPFLIMFAAYTITAMFRSLQRRRVAPPPRNFASAYHPANSAKYQKSVTSAQK